VRHVNHVTSKQIVAKAAQQRTPTRGDRSKASLGCGHGATAERFGNCQDVVTYKGAGFGIVTVLPEPACASKRCSQLAKSGGR
jgi:hypothetical protein